MSHDPKPLGGKIISKPVMIFGPLIVICMLLIVKRLVFGLGSVSDLNGGFPWGDADIDGHTDRRLEQYRVHVEVTRNVEVRQVPVATHVDSDRQATQ